MSSLLPSIPQNAPIEVQKDRILKNILQPSIREVLQQQNGDAIILEMIEKAFRNQKSYNGAKTFETYTEEERRDVQVHVFETIVTKYKNLSINEIIYVFKSGMSGDYGDNVYFSARSVNHWLREYSDNERKKSMRAYNQALQKQADAIKPEPTEAEKLQLQKDLLEGLANWIDRQQSGCSEFITLGKFQPECIDTHQYGHWWYKKLIELNLMQEPSVFDRNKYYQKALERIRPGAKQNEQEIIKAKGWLFKRQIYEWIKEDTPYRSMFTSINQLPRK